MTSPLGWIGLALLASAAVPQTFKVWREGNARGMSWWYIGLLWFGFIFMGAYAYRRHAGTPLVVSYTIQVVLFTLIAIRKKFPIT